MSTEGFNAVNPKASKHEWDKAWRELAEKLPGLRRPCPCLRAYDGINHYLDATGGYRCCKAFLYDEGKESPHCQLCQGRGWVPVPMCLETLLRALDAAWEGHRVSDDEVSVSLAKETPSGLEHWGTGTGKDYRDAAMNAAKAALKGKESDA